MSSPKRRNLVDVPGSSPEVCLLSNGRYSVMLTASGGGYSALDGTDITRWREDGTRDCWGQYCYVRNLDDGRVWSAGRQPLGRNTDEYESHLRPGRAIIRRRDRDVETCYEVAVVPDANAEVRRVTLTNRGNRPCTLEVTSYAELALNPRGADQAHPAFAKLFLETEYHASPPALICRRRPRAHDQKPVFALHVIASEVEGEVEYETDRARFLGRGRSTRNPAAMEGGVALSGTVGPVLDPVFSLRQRIRVKPGASTVLAFTTAAPEDRVQTLALAARFGSLETVHRVFEETTASDVAQRAELGLTPEDAALFQRLAASVLFASPPLRSRESVARNRLGQSGLWPHGISGDVAIALVRIGADRNLELVREVLQAHAYWRRCGLVADLVLLQDEGTGDELSCRLKDLVQNAPTAELVDRPGGVFLRDASRMSTDDATLLEAAARVLLRGGDGPLVAQLGRVVADAPALPPPLLPTGAPEEAGPEDSPAPGAALLFDNGLGGFTADGREYVITLRAGERPPAPWINVLANPDFGCLVTEAGSGYTWAGNSQMHRLTPWSNDPVTDPPGEAVYLRDEDTGEFWSPTPAPCGGEVTTVVRHGQGYSLFKRTSHDLEQDLLVLIPPTDRVKIVRLRVRNTGTRPRRLSATFYAEWVLGSLRDQASLQVVCHADSEIGALFATNAWAGEFAGEVAFAAVAAIGTDTQPHSFTTDRAEFLGREGSPEAPAALRRSRLSDRAGELVDPCAALMTPLEVPPGGEEEVVFLLGQTAAPEEARRLVRAYAAPGQVETALEEVRARWDRILGTVQVRTPDPALDLMLNRWLVYQALACRMWGRSAFYQSGGAFGFRDQLQDAMAIVYGAPGEARAQILRAAARQFEEGDVQHWWHPPAGRGVRTRISDDLVFLPLVVAHYVGVTGDLSLLDERLPFLHAPVLRPDQEEDYGLPEVSPKPESVYKHCERALECGLKLGPHGLPLMGTGDWNDGMNKVGIEGKGESVWNGWFMVATLREFAGLAERRGDGARAAWCRERADALRVALEEHAWDGRWYRRAYFDDGTPLGSAANDECQIDSIAQSWAVISGGGDPERARQAMLAVEEHLVRDADGLILLFTPPFDHGHLEPGYIKGYVPGIRENGGQYTHAATWVVLATALLGQGQRAAELFDLINPVRHAASPDGVKRYKVEPYVVCADVYGAPPHTGRGGWTWYTGSAAWLYRVGLEAILGFRLRGNRLELDPCVPPGWSGYEITYCHRSATYHVVVENSGGSGRGVRSVSVDGRAISGGVVELADDGRQHQVQIALGS
ncbi:MAG: glycosyl transferase [Acidobacteriota bacterium]|nr:glycosyl transferase [Acidobacteriota bacterium]